MMQVRADRVPQLQEGAQTALSRNCFADLRILGGTDGLTRLNA